MKTQRLPLYITILLMGILILSACSSSTPFLSTEEPTLMDVSETDIPDTAVPTEEEIATAVEAVDEDSEYHIITLLPKDAIRSIDDPEFYDVTEADAEYSPGELVIGVEFDGQARAYSVPLLSSREIVNDTVSGKPIAVTW